MNPRIQDRGADELGVREVQRKTKHDKNQFVVSVFTNGADPEQERRDTQETDMDYIEFCREVSRIQQKMQQNIPPKGEQK